MVTFWIHVVAAAVSVAFTMAVALPIIAVYIRNEKRKEIEK